MLETVQNIIREGIVTARASFIYTHLVFFVILGGSFSITNLSSGFDHISASSAKYIFSQSSLPKASQQELREEHFKSIDMVQEGLIFACAFGGGLVGAYCGLAAGLIHVVIKENEKRLNKMAQAFALAVCTAMLFGPATINYFLWPCHISLMFLVGGLFSSGCMLIWAAYHAILNRMVSKAQRDGIAGVISEIPGVGKGG